MIRAVDFCFHRLSTDPQLMYRLIRISRAEANRMMMDHTALLLREKVLMLIQRSLLPLEEKELVRRLGDYACELAERGL